MQVLEGGEVFSYSRLRGVCWGHEVSAFTKKNAAALLQFQIKYLALEITQNIHVNAGLINSIKNHAFQLRILDTKMHGNIFLTWVS